MADNKTPAGVAFKVATRETTYSGETADIQAVSLVTVAGSDDAKTATDVSTSNRLPTDATGATTSTTATWDSSTANNTTLDLDVRGYQSVLIVVATSAGTFTDGVVLYQASYDGTNFGQYSLATYQTPSVNMSTADSLVTSSTFRYTASVAGFQTIRVKLTPAIVGTGTATIVIAASQSAPETILARAYITGSGTLATTGSIAHDASASSANPLLIGGYAKSSAPTDVKSTGADAVRAWYLLNGSAAVTVTAAGALIGGDATNGMDVDVTRLPALAAGTNNIGDVDVLTVPTDPFGANADAASSSGSISAKLRQIATNGIPVTNAGTFATQVDGAALTALQLIDDPVFADDAAFTVGTSKVMVAGANTVAIGSDPDAADAGDAGAFLANRHRVQFVIGGHPNVTTVKHTNITTAVTDTAMGPTIGTGTKLCVTRLTVTLDNASTVFPTVLIGFGATTTPTTTGVLAAHGGVPAGGGFTIGDGSGVIGQGADGEELRITTTGNATGNGVQVTFSYFTLPS